MQTAIARGDKGLPVATSQASNASLPDDELSLPAMVLREKALAHNIRWMQRFVDERGLALAPHGKTTMTPAIFRRQIEAGAWGITLATAAQCRAAYREAGVRHLLMANQLVGAGNMAIVSALIADPEVTYYCTVDSVDNVRALSHFFAARNQTVQVLIELGVPGGRCGCRSQEEALALAELIDTCPGIQVAGVEGYEGIIHGDDLPDRIRAYADELIATTAALVERGLTAVKRPVITASGSAWYDVIAAAFTESGARDRFLPLLRPGCYVAHDHGLYRRAHADILARLHSDPGDGLMPALEVWAHIHSIPEPGLVVAGIGKRDIAYDADLPIPLRRCRAGGDDSALSVNGWTVTGIMDQHAFIAVPADEDVRVGDIVAFGSSHPCLTFDKWRFIALADENFRVKDYLTTRF
ncbi:amino acid deaminase [Marinobacter nanhaiticus]